MIIHRCCICMHCIHFDKSVARASSSCTLEQKPVSLRSRSFTRLHHVRKILVQGGTPLIVHLALLHRRKSQQPCGAQKLTISSMFGGLGSSINKMCCFGYVWSPAIRSGEVTRFFSGCPQTRKQNVNAGQCEIARHPPCECPRSAAHFKRARLRRSAAPPIRRDIFGTSQ